jgi:hypothetical protein
MSETTTLDHDVASGCQRSQPGAFTLPWEAKANEHN